MIILDNSLPDGTGKDLLDYIQKIRRTGGKRVCVVSISGNSSEDQKVAYEGYPVVAFLQKPLIKTQVIGLISLIDS